jgi:adenylate cyclase
VTFFGAWLGTVFLKTPVKIPLRYVLALSSLMVLLATVSVVLYSSYRTGSAAVHDLSEQLLEAHGQRAHDAVKELLAMATRQSDLAERLLRREMAAMNRDTVTAEDFSRLTAQFESIVGVNPELSYLSLGLEGTGEYCHVYRRPDGVLEQQECIRQTNGKIARADYRIKDGRRVRVAYLAATDYDPRTRPYYRQAKEAKHRVWTDTYPFRTRTGPEVPGITCATPLYRADGSLLGVLSADFTLESLNAFTRTIIIQKTGYAFIVEQRSDGARRVIAHPESGEVGKHGKQDPVRDAFLQQTDFSATGKRSQNLHVHAGDAAYLGNVRLLNDKQLPHWALFSLVPEAEIMAGVERSAAQGRLIALLGILTGALVGVVVAYRLTKLIGRVIGEMERIRRLELDPRPLPPTRIEESDKLLRAVDLTRKDLRSFEKFVPGDYVRHLVTSGQEAELSGERRNITVAFLDIVQFTAFAEKTPPEQMVSVLGEILDALTAQIRVQHGTVDKYIGDEVMALWGAQWGDLEPDHDHARNACIAAIRCQEALKRMRAQWEAKGKPTLSVRIGINTGEAVVGVMGSPVRLAFSALGDPVNLGKRVESLNSYYGTRILATDATIRAANVGMLSRAGILSRPVDFVAVVGRSEPVLVHEVMGIRSEASLTDERLADLTARAMEHYRARHWNEAIILLDEAQILRRDDGPTRLLRDSCRDFVLTPPGAEWDGIRRMLKK